jgi:predicted transcriptional regulator
MTVMLRLERNGLLEPRREGRRDVYRPVISRPDYLDARARDDVRALVEQHGDLALLHFARQMHELDPERRAQLRRLARGG